MLTMNEENVNPIHQLIKSLKRVGILVVAISFVINILMLTVPLYMLQIYDRVIPGHSLDTLIYLTVISLFALLVLTALDVIRSTISIKVGAYMEKKLAPLALIISADNVLKGHAYHAESLHDIASIRQFLSGDSFFTFLDAPWMPIYLFVIYLLHMSLGLLATFGALLLFMLAILNEKQTRKKSIKANIESSKLKQNTLLTIQNAEIIQAMGMNKGILNRWARLNDDALNRQTEISKQQAFILSCSKGLRMTLQVLVLGVGAFYVVQNVITAGVMITASIIMSRALAPVEQALSSWRQMQRTREAYYRLIEYFNNVSLQENAIKLPEPQGEIRLESVYFVPPKMTKPTLSNINLKINAGDCVAIIGPCSSGKSSLVKLIVGAWAPTSGKVQLDKASIYNWDRLHFGEFTGYLPEDTKLFHARIKDIIARMGEVDDEKVITASKLVGAHEDILQLPDGYNTIVGGSDNMLSAGQKQIISLACAFYNTPKLLVLDEPNAHLDAKKEADLFSAILEMKKKHSTIIIITHHPSLLSLVDKIIIMREGNIEISGEKETVFKQLKENSEQIDNASKKGEV
jgi:ATP-binding cassette subfamily C exporter for protease/lipase/ATP-binding cassette subfamily C protein EexD